MVAGANGYLNGYQVNPRLIMIFSTSSHKNTYLCALSVRQFLCTLLHVSPHFQREMSTEWC